MTYTYNDFADNFTGFPAVDNPSVQLREQPPSIEDTSLYRLLKDIHNIHACHEVNETSTAGPHLKIVIDTLAWCIRKEADTCQIWNALKEDADLEDVQFVLVLVLRILREEEKAFVYFLSKCRVNGIKFRTMQPPTSRDTVAKKFTQSFSCDASWMIIIDQCFRESIEWLIHFEDVIGLAKTRFCYHETIFHVCMRDKNFDHKDWKKENVIELFSALPEDLWFVTNIPGSTALHLWGWGNPLPITIADLLEIAPASVCMVQDAKNLFAIHTTLSNVLDVDEFRQLWMACGSPHPTKRYTPGSTLLTSICWDSADDTLGKCLVMMQDIDMSTVYHGVIIHAVENLCRDASEQMIDSALLRFLLGYLTDEEVWMAFVPCVTETEKIQMGGDALTFIQIMACAHVDRHSCPQHMLTVEEVDNLFLPFFERFPTDTPERGMCVYPPMVTTNVVNAFQNSVVAICCVYGSHELVKQLFTLIPPPVRNNNYWCNLIVLAYRANYTIAPTPNDRDRSDKMSRIVESFMPDREAIRSIIVEKFSNQKGGRMVHILYPRKA